MKMHCLFSRHSVVIAVVLMIGLSLSAMTANAQTQQTTGSRERLIPPASDTPTTWPLFLNEAGELQRISLDELLARTLDQNLDIRVERFNEAIARDGVEGARGIYDPALTASFNWSDTTSQSTIDPTSGFTSTATQVDNKSGSLGAQQLLSTGGVLGFGTTSSRNELVNALTGTGFNPMLSTVYSREYSIFVRQPLLNGFGSKITNSGIALAQKQHAIANERFRSQVQRQVADAMRLYWELVYAISIAQVQETALTQANGLLRNNQIRLEYGAGSSLDVSNTEATVADRRGFLINAKASIHTVQDQVKKLMGLQGDQAAWAANLAPIDQPQLMNYPLDLEKFINETMANNPDWRQLQLGQEVLEINERVAKNMKRPRLDLFSSYAWTGAAGSHSAADDSARGDDYDTKVVGIEFSYPLWNRAAKFAHRQSQKMVEQNDVSLTNLQDLLIQQVRGATRDIQTARDLTESNAVAVSSQVKKLAGENDRFEAGSATPQDILRYQTDLANARTNYLRSIINYQQAIITLELTKGTLLETLGIKIEQVSPIDY